MPQITKITKQKKRERFNVFLDDQFAFSLNNYTLLKNNLKVGKDIPQDQITNILAKEQRAQLTDLASRFLALRPRSEKEVKDYIAKKNRPKKRNEV